MNLPRHLAIIMDGNGRWAKARHHNRVYGHLRGAKIAKTVIEECARLNLSHLTLFAFSTENWFRPLQEVRFLMHLLRRQLLREKTTLMRNNIRFQVIGEIDRLPPEVRDVIADILDETASNTGMILTFALSYGGRQEITLMARELVRQAKLGLLDETQVDQALVAGLLPSSFLPDPDLIIRTSGESRISNFFLWQAAYSEIEFEDKSWPEFTLDDLHRILSCYSARERRFGRTSEQLQTR
ncbi:MAG: di-trans,poly-cis-decaprenylcistransferase [Bdellovibrionales bacterium]|nr:di-trans,poly-cis-decaprenylcistransferase [Bdellovibrionales bacterium]